MIGWPGLVAMGAPSMRSGHALRPFMASSAMVDYGHFMKSHRIFCALGLWLACQLAAPKVLAQASGPAQGVCLSSEQMREAIFAGHAVPATAATRAARDASAGDVVRVRLCRENDNLIYRVTMLQRDGRVGHVTIDGSSGKVSDVR